MLVKPKLNQKSKSPTMKKLLFLIVQGFLAISLSAQHIDNVQQTGNYNSSLVEQQFTNPAAGIFGNSAAIVQNGNNNNSTVYQQTFGGVSILPIDPFVAPDGNFVGVNQVGNYNEAVVSQIWKANQGLINSSGSYNYAFLQQRGIFNQSLINQIYDNNHGTVKIFGQFNISLINQMSLPGNAATTKNFAIQIIGSDDGLSDMVESSELRSTQVGIDNYSYQEIQGSPVIGNSINNKDNKGTMIQSGNSNKAEQKMHNGKGIVADNTAELSQGGNSNNSLQYMKGSSNTSSHAIIGSNNMTYTYQNWP